jgi:hypothetical protein
MRPIARMGGVAVDAAEDGQPAAEAGADRAPVLRGGRVARRGRLLEAKAQLEAEDQAAREGVSDGLCN